MKRYWFSLHSLIDCNEILFRKNLIKLKKMSGAYLLTYEDGSTERITFANNWEYVCFGKYDPGPYPNIDNVCKNCSKLFKDGKFCVKHPFPFALKERVDTRIARCEDFYPKDEYFERRIK